MKTIIDKSECKPLSDNIEGKLVVIKPDFFKPEFREAKYQIVLALSGFGCDVCGYNSGWKQDTNMGKRVNQKFVSIPYLSIVQRLEYKCENEGIKFIKTNESYTSGTSFLDGEEPIEKNYNKDRRIHRGLFQSEKGEYINADVNGSYQIMKKVFPKAFINGIVDAGSHPVVVNIPLQTANVM